MARITVKSGSKVISQEVVGATPKDVMAQHIVGVIPREVTSQEIVGTPRKVSDQPVTDAPQLSGKVQAIRPLELETGTSRDYHGSLNWALNTVLNGKPLRSEEIRGIVGVWGGEALKELDRLSSIAGRQGTRYLLSSIVLYDNPKEAFQTISSYVKRPSDLRQHDIGIPRNFIGEFFQLQVRLYLDRQEHRKPHDTKQLPEDLLDAFSRSHSSGGALPVRESAHTAGKRRGREPEEDDPAQHDRTRRLEEG